MRLANKIYHLDYLKFLRKVPSNSVNLLLTDPPFGIGYQNNYTQRKHNFIRGDDVEFSYRSLAQEAYRVMKNNSAVFCFTGWSTYGKHFEEFRAAGFLMKEPLICQKRPSGKTDLYGTFQSNSDWCLFGHKGRFRFKPTELVVNKKAGSIPNKGRKPVAKFKTRFPSCWFGPEYPWSSENSQFQKQTDIYHPTIKSSKMMEWLILLTTVEGDIVCDPFVGSGTTAVAAFKLGRKFLGCELELSYQVMASLRLNEVMK